MNSHWIGLLLLLLPATLALAGSVPASPAVPFSDELDAAAISQDRLDSIHENSLILGNGDLNGLLYSSGGSLVLRITKNDVWDARIDTSGDPETTTIDIKGWKTNGSKGSWSSWSKPYPCPRACANVELKGSTAEPPARSVLDLCRAVARVLPAGQGPPAAELRALSHRNAFIIDSPAHATLKAILSPHLPAAEQGVREGVAWLTQRIPGDPDWPGMTFAVALASAGNRKAVAVVTSRESKDPLGDAVTLARATATNDAALVRKHEDDWRAFWSASGVKLDDAALTAIWYCNLYFLRCVSKPGVVAVGLFAGLVNDKPAWHGGHTINYNTQQTFQGAFTANHVELAQPVEQLVADYLPRARWLARKTYNCGGAFFPHNLYPYEPPDPEACRGKNHRVHVCTPWAHTIGNSGFLVQNLWWHYQYQPDPNYLEKTAWPALRDVAVFYADFMDQCRAGPPGKVILAPSVSPEHWDWTPNMERNRNCAYDIAFVRFAFRAAIEAATILGREPQLVERFKKELARLPDYPTTKGDRPIVVDVEDAPPTTYNIAVPAVPVFPGEQVTWFSGDAEKQLFARTIDGLRWNGNNSAIMLAVARARLSMPGSWQWLKDEMAARSRPNGTITLNRRGNSFNNYGHYTEQFAATMAVGELLIQSVDGIVRVFPAWPKDRSARFENLRTVGGFLFSAEQADGEVRQVDVISTVGGRLRLVSPWPSAAVKRSDSAAPVPLKPDGGGIIEIETKAGERLLIIASR
jgi:hypothetical protein